MLIHAPWGSTPLRNISAFAQFMIVGAFVVTLVGCSGDGGGGSPIVSSAASPTAEENPSGDVNETGEVPSLGGEEDPTGPGSPQPVGSTAKLTWDAPANPDITTYYVYYGKQSSGQPGSCTYESSQSVEAPPATITGLEPNTTYFFAISAFGESESLCSNEMLVVTPPAQS